METTNADETWGAAQDVKNGPRLLMKILWVNFIECSFDPGVKRCHHLVFDCSLYDVPDTGVGKIAREHDRIVRAEYNQTFVFTNNVIDLPLASNDLAFLRITPEAKIALEWCFVFSIVCCRKNLPQSNDLVLLHTKQYLFLVIQTEQDTGRCVFACHGSVVLESINLPSHNRNLVFFMHPRHNLSCSVMMQRLILCTSDKNAQITQRLHSSVDDATQNLLCRIARRHEIHWCMGIVGV